MSVKYVQSAPTEVTFSGSAPALRGGATYTPDEGDIASQLSPEDVELIAEIFHTPLNGSYVWDYREADKRIRKLYRLGKERNWNADLDVNWERFYPHSESPMIEGGENPYEGW